MADRENIIEKIRKMLALADERNGGTEGERSNAMAMAQALMMKHRIEEYELAQAEGRHLLPGIVMVDIGDFKQGRMWIPDLMRAIADPMVVDSIWSPRVGGSGFVLVGRPESIAYVQLLTNWIVPQLVRHGDVELNKERTSAQRAGAPWLPGHSITFRRSFYAAAVQRLTVRLEQALAVPTAGSGQELVLSDKKAVEDYYAAQGISLSSHKSALSPMEAFAYGCGHAAGDKVDINPSNKVNPRAALELNA